ncbi:alcohol dehydrogenase-like isoform X2 [Glandiceps talaboti]
MAESTTMRCVKMVKPGPAELQYVTDQERPSLPSEGAIVKVHYCGMCHSDVHMWSIGRIPMPFIFGHEVSGTIDLIGPSAANPEGLRIGDQVAVYPWTGCENRACKPCQTGNSSYCDLGPTGHKEIGVSQDGGYAEYVAIPKLTFLVKVPETVPMEVAGLLGCGMLTAYNAVQTLIPKIDPILHFRDKCGILIIGAGGLGLSAVQLLKSLVLPNYENVELVCADIQETKLSLAMEAGSHGIVHWLKEDSEGEMVKKTSSVFTEKGADIVIDFVGSKQTFNVGLKSLKRHGTLICVGLHAIGKKQELPLYQAVVKSFCIRTVYAGSLQQMKELIQLVANGKVSTIPCKVYPLKDAVQLMYQLQDGKIEGRAILSPKLNHVNDDKIEGCHDFEKGGMVNF